MSAASMKRAGFQDVDIIHKSLKEGAADLGSLASLLGSGLFSRAGRLLTERERRSLIGVISLQLGIHATVRR